MPLELTHIIDFWLGIPLCWISTVIHSLSLRLQRVKTIRPKKILFIELSEMGSAIIAYSALARARALYGNDLYFLIFRKNSESVSVTSVIPEENIITIDERNIFVFALSFFKAILKIRKLNIDTTIDLELFARCTSIISFLSGAERKVGFYRHTHEGCYRGNFLSHRVLYNSHQHMALNFLALVASLEAPADEYPMLKRNLSDLVRQLPPMDISTKEREKIWRQIQVQRPDVTAETKFIILNPDPGALPLRGWPVDRFVEVSQQILERYPDIILIVTGLQRSKTFAELLQKRLGSERCLDLTGKTASVREAIVLLSFGKVLVTNDSGPAHLATLTDTEIVVLFGPETPMLYGPVGTNVQSLYAGLSCSPCYAASNHRRTRCRDNKCLQAISVSQVFTAIRRALGENPLPILDNQDDLKPNLPEIRPLVSGTMN